MGDRGSRGRKEWNWRDGWEVGTEGRGRRKDEMEGRDGWEEWTEERGELERGRGKEEWKGRDGREGWEGRSEGYGGKEE